VAEAHWAIPAIPSPLGIFVYTAYSISFQVSLNSNEARKSWSLENPRSSRALDSERSKNFTLQLMRKLDSVVIWENGFRSNVRYRNSFPVSHYIPRFILSNFAHPFQPLEVSGRQKRQRNKSRREKGYYPGDLMLYTINLAGPEP
jgi:hypothetical protein